MIETEATGAPQKHHHTLNQQIGSITMNPKSMTPVAFWVVNRNTDFSGGDYVDWHEVETVSVPKMLQECHKNPAAKLGDLSAVIKK
ncbi:HdeA/HdeB family chaperone [Klebsiella pneumoniae]|uniref:HdeA/HdeB family chaperone n=1 Tax=Klebsiella pneumoniae TaxID=573 RepID=UPI001E3D61D5|nr:HdeA/HdeB family chaperone [Klebsiella pneumoniae]